MEALPLFDAALSQSGHQFCIHQDVDGHHPFCRWLPLHFEFSGVEPFSDRRLPEQFQLAVVISDAPTVLTFGLQPTI
jgi:hypothetical protein